MPRRPLLLLSLTALFGTAAAVACRSSDAATPPPLDTVRPVRIAAILDTTLREPVSAAGTLGARDEVSLAFKVGGIIASVAVNEGQRVRAGQVLATLELPEIDAGVAKARAAFTKAERDRDRAERLVRDSVATRTQLQDAQTAYDVARADLDAVQFNRGRAVIVAPAAGTILRAMARPGELVGPGTPVITLASATRGTVFRMSIPDRDIVRVRTGDAAVVRLDAAPDRVLRGTVREVGAAPGATGTYLLEIGLPDAADLPSGLVGRGEVTSSIAHPAQLVPVESVLEADGHTGTAFVLTSMGADSIGVVERRQVTIAWMRGTRMAITGGLSGARAVVVDGAPYLEQGARVRVMP